MLRDSLHSLKPGVLRWRVGRLCSKIILIMIELAVANTSTNPLALVNVYPFVTVAIIFSPPPIL